MPLTIAELNNAVFNLQNVVDYSTIIEDVSYRKLTLHELIVVKSVSLRDFKTVEDLFLKDTVPILYIHKETNKDSLYIGSLNDAQTLFSERFNKKSKSEKDDNEFVITFSVQKQLASEPAFKEIKLGLEKFFHLFLSSHEWGFQMNTDAAKPKTDTVCFNRAKNIILFDKLKTQIESALKSLLQQKNTILSPTVISQPTIVIQQQQELKGAENICKFLGINKIGGSAYARLEELVKKGDLIKTGRGRWIIVHPQAQTNVISTKRKRIFGQPTAVTLDKYNQIRATQSYQDILKSGILYKFTSIPNVEQLKNVVPEKNRSVFVALLRKDWKKMNVAQQLSS